MALNFPNSPTDNQTWTDPSNGSVYQYSADFNYWRVIGLANGNGTVNYVAVSGTNGIKVTGDAIVNVGEFELELDIADRPSNTTINNNNNFIIEQSGTNRKISVETLTNFLGGKPIISPTAPVASTTGQMWWDTVNGLLFIWYDDGDSSQWVEASPSKLDLTDYYTADEVDTKSVVNASASGSVGHITWNSPQGVKICQQWGVVTHNVSGNATIAFPIAYQAGTIPNLTVTTLRYSNSNSYCSISAITNTTATLSATLPNGNPAVTTTRWSSTGVIV